MDAVYRLLNNEEVLIINDYTETPAEAGKDLFLKLPTEKEGKIAFILEYSNPERILILTNNVKRYDLRAMNPKEREEFEQALMKELKGG